MHANGRPWRSASIWMAISALALASCEPAAKREASSADGGTVQPIAVTLAPVEQRAYHRSAEIVGTLFGAEEMTITPKVEGRVVAIHHDVGDRVGPEELLLELEPVDYELAVEEARRARDFDLARLGLKTLPDVYDISDNPNVVTARLRAENAVRKLKRAADLRAKGAIPPEDYDTAETESGVAAAALRQVGLETQATLASARHKSALLAIAEQRLKDVQVNAPPFPTLSEKSTEKDCYLVAERMLSEGEMVRAMPATPAFRLILDSPLKMKARVPERYVGMARVGLDAKVRVDAYDEDFPARIVRLNRTVDPRSRTFEIEAQVPNADHRLQPGSFAKARIFSPIAEKILTVPIESVVSYAGVHKVFVAKGDQVHVVPVQLGDQGSGWVEVKGNLNAGDLVTTSGQTRLTQGAAIRVLRPNASDAADPRDAEPDAKRVLESTPTEKG